MEFPDLGQHCTEPSCKQLDYLPVKCDACSQIFCHEHMKYANHNCPSAYKKNVQVPVCPLCNQPVPVGKNQQPDIVVGAHIDNDCQSQPAQAKRKVFTNKCSMKGCKQKEMIPVTCPECQLNFCLRHRHNQDHQCEGVEAGRRRRAVEAAKARQSSSGTMQNAFSSAAAAASRMFNKSPRPPPVASIQGSMSEDEALARALAASMNSNPAPSQPVRVHSLTQQEEEDRQLALALQQSEQEQRRTRSTSGNSTSKNCNVS